MSLTCSSFIAVLQITVCCIICSVYVLQGKELAVKAKYNKIKGKSQELITNWEDKSREFIDGFIGLFGTDNVMVRLTSFFFFAIFSFLNQSPN